MERVNKGTAADVLKAAVPAVLGLLLAWAGLQTRPAGPGGWAASLPALETQAGHLCAVAGSVLLLWWCVGAVCAVSSSLLSRRGYQVAGRRTALLAPPFMRRLAAAALGAGLLVQAGPAYAAAPSPGVSAASPAVPEEAVPGPAGAPALAATAAAAADEPPTPLWQPDPVAPGSTLLTRPGRSTATESETSVSPDINGEIQVAAGDSLWSLAARQLGPAADPAAIAAQWPKWFELNRAVIGDDPDLLVPGQLLRIPPL